MYFSDSHTKLSSSIHLPPPTPSTKTICIYSFCRALGTCVLSNIATPRCTQCKVEKRVTHIHSVARYLYMHMYIHIWSVQIALFILSARRTIKLGFASIQFVYNARLYIYNCMTPQRALIMCRRYIQLTVYIFICLLMIFANKDCLMMYECYILRVYYMAGIWSNHIFCVNK